MRRATTTATSVVALAVLAAGTLAAAPTAPLDDAQAPVDSVVDTVATATGACDELDPRLCLLPFPNDHFTTLDATTPTGRRVDLSPLATPRNVAGKPVDPTEWNRNDGFSPGSMVLTHVPGLDLTATYGLDPTPETGVGTEADPFVVRDAEPDAVIEAPELSMAADAPIVLLDADTGERHPYWAELDAHPETIADGADRTLIVRPLRNLREGHRYIVALRDLRDADGQPIAAGESFRTRRDAWDPPAGQSGSGPPPCDANHPGQGHGPACEGTRAFPAPADVDPADPDARYDDIFTRLDATGVAVDELYLAWDFHVASGRNLAGRALAIRDDAFAQLGDTDLADGQVEGRTPPMTISAVEDGTSDGLPTRTVRGTVTVPNYLTTPQEGVDTSTLDAAEDAYGQLPAALRDADPGAGEVVDLAGEVPLVLPQSRFVYDTPTPGPMAVPRQNPVVPTTEAEFTCRFRTDVAGGARPTLYGHGLLGGRGETEGSSTADLRRGGHAMCGVDWIGMATEDLPNVALILHDISFFPSLADRAQQGFLNFLYVGRALLHPDGAAAHAAFRDADGQPLLDTGELFYDGNSQGGIMGGALTALAPDFTKSVLGVPGMNYSTLLNRSVDWEGEFLDPADPDIPAYASFTYNAYPDKVEQQLLFAMLQMLWDRAEGNGYAQHMTDEPYPNTPPHQVLLEVAFGDYQVTNHAAEVEARSIGADFLGTALAPGRHWERDYATGDAAVPYGLDDFVTADDGVRHAPSGSAIVYWDSGNPIPPNANVPPVDLGQDPHGDPRKDDAALRQKLRFYETGSIVDVNEGRPNWTDRCRHPVQGHTAC